jgi:hypothetical protein
MLNTISDPARRLRRRLTDPVHLQTRLEIQALGRRVDAMATMQASRFVAELLADPRYDDPKRLTRAGRKVYSQFDEDGILAEIFARIAATFVEAFTGEIDLLSIDVDGNDIWLLEAIDLVRPRVIVVEYNATFPPPMSIATAYDATHRWSGTDRAGASLVAIERMARRRGYRLVGCGIGGVKAFLVQEELVGTRFAEPFTAENHDEPPRYFLADLLPAGHPPDWGAYVEV